MAAISRVVMFDDVLYQPGHMVWRYIGNLTRHFSANAKEAAPVRTGQLRNRIRAGTPRKGGKRRVHGSISSNAPHTTFVIHGTTGPIMSNAAWAAGGPVHEVLVSSGGKAYLRGSKGHMMAVGRNAYPPVTPMGEVSGQRSNNFFYWAWVKTARRHPSIRGVPFPAVLH
jgi:hypothetical protein